MQLATLLLEQKYIIRIRVRAVRNELTLCMQGNFACFLLSADFFSRQLFRKTPIRNIVRVSNSLGPDHPPGLIWIQTVCKGYDISRQDLNRNNIQ